MNPAASPSGPRSRARRLIRLLAPVWEARARRLAVERLLVDGDATGARSAAEDAAREFPHDAEFPYLVGRACAALGACEREAAAYAEALARDPRHARADAAALRLRAARHRPVMQGWRLHEAGLFVAAREAFAGARAAAGADAEGVLLLAETWRGAAWCALAVASDAVAADEFAEAIRWAPTSASSWLGLGIARFRRSAFDASEAALHEALRLNPSFADARSFLGWCAYGRGDFVGAEREFAAAVALNPLTADPRYGLAWCAVRRDDPERATTFFAEAAARGVAHPSRRDAAALAASDPRYAAAEAALSAAEVRLAAEAELRAPPAGAAPPAPARLTDALEALAAGDAVAAAALTEGAVDAPLRIVRGRALRILGRMDEACSEFRAARALDDAAPAAALEEARTLIAVGRAADARAALRPLLDRNIDDADVLETAASAAEAAGDRRDARKLRARAAIILSAGGPSAPSLPPIPLVDRPNPAR